MEKMADLWAICILFNSVQVIINCISLQGPYIALTGGIETITAQLQVNNGFHGYQFRAIYGVLGIIQRTPNVT